MSPSTQALPLSPTRRRLLLSAVFAPVLLVAGETSRSGTPIRNVELHVETDGDLLEFKPKSLSCPTGAHVRLRFHHAGKYVSFEHNWVLILPRTFDAVTAAAVAAGEKQGWLPHGDKRILAATPLCGRGQVAMVEFIAPAPGDYPYICSYPGHAKSMWGVLHVTPA